MWENLFIFKNKTIIMELDNSSLKTSCWLGLPYPKTLTQFRKITENEFVHFATIDLSSFFSNSAGKSMSIFFNYKRGQLPTWKCEFHASTPISSKKVVGIKLESLVDDDNPIPWKMKDGFGLPKSKIGGKPSFLQNAINSDQLFLLQINWEDIVFEANENLGKGFNIVSEAFMGGSIYVFASINIISREMDLNKISIYHQYL